MSVARTSLGVGWSLQASGEEWKKSVDFSTLPPTVIQHGCGKRGKNPYIFPPFPQRSDDELWKAWKRSVDFSTLPTASDENGAPRIIIIIFTDAETFSNYPVHENPFRNGSGKRCHHNTIPSRNVRILEELNFGFSGCLFTQSCGH